METGRVVTPIEGNEEEVNDVGDCKPTPVAAVAISSVGLFCLFFKFGVGLQIKENERIRKTKQWIYFKFLKKY